MKQQHMLNYSNVLIYSIFYCDVCTTLDNFQENPSTLPCHESLKAKTTLFELSSRISNHVNEVKKNYKMEKHKQVRKNNRRKNSVGGNIKKGNYQLHLKSYIDLLIKILLVFIYINQTQTNIFIRMGKILKLFRPKSPYCNSFKI